MFCDKDTISMRYKPIYLQITRSIPKNQSHMHKRIIFLINKSFMLKFFRESIFMDFDIKKIPQAFHIILMLSFFCKQRSVSETFPCTQYFMEDFRYQLPVRR